MYRCPESLQNHCTEGCKFSEVFEGIPPENYLQNFEPKLVEQALYAFSITREITARSRRGSFADDMDTGTECPSTSQKVPGNQNLLDAQIGGRVLCLDGGGIRGIILTQTLWYMERVIIRNKR